MSYAKRYYFTFIANDTGNTPDQGDSYIAEIHQKDYVGVASEIQAQRNPVTLEYSDSSKDVFLSLRASRAVLNLISDPTFSLADLYSEDERTWLLKVYRTAPVLTRSVSWSLDETPGSDYADVNLQIFINGVNVVDEFSDSSGTFQILDGDTLTVSAYAITPWPAGNAGMNLEVTGKPTLRTIIDTVPLTYSFIPVEDISISAYSTFSATQFTAIRSDTFQTDCPESDGSIVSFTKTYTSFISQANAQSAADGDTGFTTEGQNYADANGVCHVGSYLLWQGFILPEGCDEEFTFAPYILTAQVADGLGVLKNLSFVEEDGTFFTGKMSYKDVIWNCLNRLQIPGMTLNTSVNLYWEGLTPADATDPLAETFVSVETYFKDEDFTPMTCEDVLTSVMEQWTACIVQMNGNWYVYRPNELAVKSSAVFRKYSATTGDYTGTEIQSIDRTLGGLSQGELIYHIERSQYKSIAKPFKNATISYKYGLLRSVLDNPTLAGASQSDPGDPLGPRTDITIPGWTKFGTLDNGITTDGAVIFYKESSFDSANYFLNDETVSIEINQQIQLNISYESIPALTTTDMLFGIEFDDGTDIWYLQADGSGGGYVWSKTGVLYAEQRSNFGASTSQIVSEPVPANGTVRFKIYPPDNTVGDIVYNSVDAVKYNANEAQVGEIHKAEQTGTFSFVPEIINVFNGDGTTDLYRGTIYENDGDTAAGNWIRSGVPESILATPYQLRKPFLRIASEEILRMHQRPMNVYDGTVAGFFPFLTRFTIRDLSGYYLPVQVNYSLQEGSITTTLVEVTNDEIECEYELLPDYGSVTKVSINGI